MQRVNRTPFEALVGPFEEWPTLQCPACELAVLEATVTEIESFASVASRVGVTAWSGWYRGVFHGTLACSRTPCGNIYVIAGEWSRRSDFTSNNMDDDPGLAGIEVRHILPSLPLISLPANVPATVCNLIDSASSVLLSDPSAAATRIRAAIERLLDDLRVRKTSPGNKAKRLQTHDRIVTFSRQNAPAADQLMAMKWIGNVGTHESTPLPLNVVLNGIEHFARAIELIYDHEGEALARRAAHINKRGGKLRARHLAS
jgi:Domain of unknown function (DUF4145)